MDRILIILLYILLFLVMYIDINKKYIPNILNFSILVLSIFICGIDRIDIFFIGASCYTLPILIFYGYISDILKKEVFGFGDIKLIIDMEKTEIDFSNRKEKASLIKVEYRGDKKIYKNTLLKFEG